MPLNLCYGVALWDGEVDKATVEKLYQRWVELSGFRQSRSKNTSPLPFGEGSKVSLSERAQKKVPSPFGRGLG